MIHQHHSLSFNAYSDAMKLASNGTEFSHLVSLMTPDHALRLKVFVQQLPDELANLTIYGRSVKAQINKPKKK